MFASTPSNASDSSRETRILIIEDHPIVRAGLEGLVSLHPGLTVAAAIGTAEETETALASHPVDLVLLDLMLGHQDTLGLISDLTHRHPGLKILVISAMSESVYAERVLRAGALGYVMKSAATSEVLLAITSVVEGRIYLSPKIFVSLFRGLLHRSSLEGVKGAEGLSDRELQVFQLIGANIPNREIAQQLGISVKTVETHRENLKNKLGVTDSVALAAAAQTFVGSIAH